MTHGLHTTMRRASAFLVTLAVAAALSSSALGGTGSGLNLPPQSAIDAASANWAAKAKLLDVDGRPLFAQAPDLSSVDAQSASWAAKAKLLNAYGRPAADVTATGGGSPGFAWSDFGIGAGAMLGLMLLATGLAAGAHYSRRGVTRHRAAA